MDRDEGVGADVRRLFLSSAHRTESAFHINRELGILITGWSGPVLVDAHFARMVETGILVNA